jgi:REP-associated tyrosine transposase
MKPRRPKRLEGFTYIGKHAYSLTICTFQRYEAFRDVDFTRQSIAKLLITAKKFGFAVVAYCFMPDHVHLVVMGQRDDSALESFVKSLNTQLGFYWHQKTGGTLWQGGYRDDILRADASVILTARYVVMNPVRAGLVDDPKRYEFSGSDCYTIDEILDDGCGPANPSRQT